MSDNEISLLLNYLETSDIESFESFKNSDCLKGRNDIIRNNKKIQSFNKKSRFSEEEAYYQKTLKRQVNENKRYSTETVKADSNNDKQFLYLKTLVEQGRKIESLKQNLVLKSDFCCMKAFDFLLGEKNRNYLILEDFQSFLPSINEEGLILLFKRHSNNEALK